MSDTDEPRPVLKPTQNELPPAAAPITSRFERTPQQEKAAVDATLNRLRHEGSGYHRTEEWLPNMNPGNWSPYKWVRLGIGLIALTSMGLRACMPHRSTENADNSGAPDPNIRTPLTAAAPPRSNPAYDPEYQERRRVFVPAAPPQRFGNVPPATVYGNGYPTDVPTPSRPVAPPSGETEAHPGLPPEAYMTQGAPPSGEGAAGYAGQTAPDQPASENSQVPPPPPALGTGTVSGAPAPEPPTAPVPAQNPATIPIPR